MKVASIRRRVQIFVCNNRRDEGDSLGAGCGDRGDEVHDEMRAEIGRRGAWGEVWLARSGCLGVCPKRGCTVAVTPGPSVKDGGAQARLPVASFLVQDVEVDDVGALLDVALR